jgi:hypothetical protein
VEREMGFLLRFGFRLGLVLALAAFVLAKSAEKGRLAKENPLNFLREAATARVVDEAQKRCEQHPRDCLTLLKEATRRAEAGR